MESTFWQRRRSNEPRLWLPPLPPVMVQEPRRRKPTEEDYFADSEMASDYEEPRQRRPRAARHAESEPPEGCILDEFPRTSRSRIVVGTVGLLLAFVIYRLFFA